MELKYNICLQKVIKLKSTAEENKNTQVNCFEIVLKYSA